MSLSTRTGDSGQTSLANGQRVSKADIRIQCCGAADELSAALGLARSLQTWVEIKATLSFFQTRLLALAAELSGASPQEPIGEADLVTLDDIADVPGWTGFVLPGDDPASAALHLARTAARRLERTMVAAGEQGVTVRPLLLCYVNRLSDALFALALPDVPVS